MLFGFKSFFNPFPINTVETIHEDVKHKHRLDYFYLKYKPCSVYYTA